MRFRRSIADQLRAERAAAGLTQVQLAEKVGVSGATVIRWEKATRDIPAVALLAVGEALDISPREFMAHAQERFER